MKTRLEYNLEILKQLESYFIQNSDMRFFQGLWDVGVIEYANRGGIDDKFSQESKKTLEKLLTWEK